MTGILIGDGWRKKPAVAAVFVSNRDHCGPRSKTGRQTMGDCALSPKTVERDSDVFLGMNPSGPERIQ